MKKTTEKQRKINNGNPSGSGFKAGQSGNPKGRAKKYLTSVTDKTGYRNSEIQDCIKSMLRMTTPEIKQIIKDDTTPVLEKIIASGIQSDIENGELRNLETLMNRSYGKPKEFIEVEQVDKYKELTKEEIETELERRGLNVERFMNGMYDV